MTKREFKKYNSEVYDMVGNRLYPGDTVVLPASYYHEVYIGVVKYFGEKTVVMDVKRGKIWYTTKRAPSKILKIVDKNGDTSFMQNWPKREEIVN